MPGESGLADKKPAAEFSVIIENHPNSSSADPNQKTNSFCSTHTETEP